MKLLRKGYTIRKFTDVVEISKVLNSDPSRPFLIEFDAKHVPMYWTITHQQYQDLVDGLVDKTQTLIDLGE